MAEITFKVAYLYPSSDTRLFTLEAEDKRGNRSFISTEGLLWRRTPEKGDSIATIPLTAVEEFEYQGQKKKRVYALIKYETDEKKVKLLSQQEEINNRIHREAHNFIKNHPQVVYKDSATGNNLNTEQRGNALFELIEESQRIISENEKNIKIAKAMGVASDMFENNKEAFVEFCYAYGIRPVQGVEVQKLFNEVSFKIRNNPNEFFEVYEHEEREMLSLIKRAMQELDGENTILYIENDFWCMNGEILATDEHPFQNPLLHHFKTHPRDKDFLLRKLGITKEVVLEVKELAPVSEEFEDTIQKKSFDAKAHEHKIRKMKATVTNAATKYRKSEKRQADIDRLKAEITDARESFLDIVEAYDSYAKDKLTSLGLE